MFEEKNNTDKLTDKAFSRLVATSVLGIVICIICLCSSTWAWFGDTAPSKGNVVSAAGQCLLKVSVSDDVNVIETVDISSPETIHFDAGNTYTVTLTLPKNSSSGYLVIDSGEGKIYTDYLEAHKEDVEKTLSFTLEVEEATDFVFTLRWGIYSSDADVRNGENLFIPKQ